MPRHLDAVEALSTVGNPVISGQGIVCCWEPKHWTLGNEV